jgi:branched-chain amino acid transport system substrate-binding protein
MTTPSPTGDEFKKALEANRVQITSTQTFAHTDRTGRPVDSDQGHQSGRHLRRCAHRAAVGIVTQARQLLGDTIPIISSNASTHRSDQRRRQGAESVVIGAWHISSTNAKSQAFTRAFKAKFGETRTSSRRRRTLASTSGEHFGRRAQARDAIRRTWERSRASPPALGNFSFNAQRDAEHPPVVQIVKNGQFAIASNPLGQRSPTPSLGSSMPCCGGLR